MIGKPGCVRDGTLNLNVVGLLVFILAAILLLDPLVTGCLWAEGGGANSAKESKSGDPEANSGSVRYSVFSLRHISAQKGKEYLAEAKIGTVSQLPGDNRLLVTAQPDELVKAGAILKLVDAKQEYVVRAISPASSAQGYSSGEQIVAGLAVGGDILIGTFSNPPTGAAQAKAIVDIHNGAVIAIAPANRLKGIISAFERLPILQKDGKTGTQQLQEIKVGLLQAGDPNETAEPKAEKMVELKLAGPERMADSSESAGRADANDTDSSELFSRLLRSLAEAEKRAAERSKQVGEANEPNAVIIVPEANLPSEPTVAPGARQVGTGQLTGAELAEILKRLEALEARGKAEPEPKPDVAPKPELIEIEDVAPKIEHPNEVNEVAAPNALPDEERVLMLDLPEKIPIGDFLGFVGEHLQLNYMYDPTKVKGDVTLWRHGKLRGPIKVKEVYPLLETVLQFHGFAMTRKGDLVIIRPVSEVASLDALIVRDEGERIDTGNVIVTRIFELKHIDTASAQNLLAGMQLGLKVTPIPETGTLIVEGYAYRMQRIEELLELVDLPGEPKKFKFRQLKYTMAKVLAPKVKTLVEQLEEGISITIAESAAPAPAAAVTRKPGESTAAFRRREAEARRAKRGGGAPRGGPPKGAAPGKAAVYLDFDERTNRILMIGFEDELNIVEQLIDSLDVVQQDPRSLHLYQIQNVDAEEVRIKLQELGIIGAGRAVGRGAAGRAGRLTERTPPAGKAGPPARTPLRSRTGVAAEEAPSEEPQVVIIETTNSLLVNATPEQHAQIAMIIRYVDTETPPTDIPYVVYPLENQAPEDLAGILNQLILETVTKKDPAGKTETTVTKKTEEEITIIADKNTFSLIVYASKKNQKWVENLIKTLDKRRPQVLIDVTLVQITKDDVFNLDLKLLAAIPDMTFPSGAIAEVTSTIADKLLSAESDRSRFIEFASDPLAGNFTGFYGDEKINALLTAMQLKSYGRVMARPKLLVNDNETGSIVTSETTFIKRVDTSWMGVENPQQTERTVFDSYSAGITLNITPHISEGDMLRLEITLNRSGFDPDTLGKEKPPDRADADVTTVVTVPDKSTIILGGMEKVESGKGGNKVPFLGDLPVLGGLFRSVSRIETQNKLYIFVKAHILRPGGEDALSDLKEVSRQNRDKFEKLEREMGEYGDWPGIKPAPLDPLRVLEDD